MTVSAPISTSSDITVTSTPAAASAADTTITADRFLKLLVAQMQNQDPLNPMDNAQVTSQMAQINTVTGIDKLNTTLPSYETIKRFSVLERDFSQETGELTPTLKVKRKACTVKYSREIDAMYDGEAAE